MSETLSYSVVTWKKDPEGLWIPVADSVPTLDLGKTPDHNPQSDDKNKPGSNKGDRRKGRGGGRRFR